MTGALWPSAWVAAIFAIHPLRVESVAWVAERKDVLSGFFFMLTLWFYARYVERPASWGRHLLVVASFFLGLLAKPMLVTLPFVLLLLDYWPLGRLGAAHGSVNGSLPQRTPVVHAHGSPVRGLFVEKIPLFVLAIASCAITLWAQSGAINSLTERSLPARFANAVVAYVDYLGKMIYPADLAVLYPFPSEPLPNWEVFGAIAGLLAISIAVWVGRRHYPYLLVGWLWYLGTLAPVIGLVQVGSQKMADRYTYLTQVGLYVAIAWGAARICGAWPNRRLLVAVASVLILAVLVRSAWRQTQYWQDSVTLWTHTLASTTQNVVAHTNLGLALADRGQVDEAIEHYREALRLKPDSAETLNDLGLALAERGQLEDAVKSYRAETR